MDGRWRGKEVSCLFSARNKTVGKLLFFAGLANFKALLERWVFSMSKIFVTRSQYRYIRTRKLGTLGDAQAPPQVIGSQTQFGAAILFLHAVTCM